MVRVVVAPDSFGGTLTSSGAAEAIVTGWHRSRPDDELVVIPMADGGEGTIDVVASAADDIREAEVADPLGRPRTARWLHRSDGTAVIESAQACGLALLEPAERDPLRTTTYGVGQLLESARRTGATRIVVGLGGSATVDGGAGALIALGLRILRSDGQGLKVGGGELEDVGRIEPGWLDDGWEHVEVALWSDVTTRLPDAAQEFGPQKGADEGTVAKLRGGLARWADVVERDLGGITRSAPGTGAAGGLGFGLAAAVGARFGAGAEAVARAVGLPEALARADLVVTGEGRLDRTSATGKVVGTVVDLAGAAGVPVAAVAGQVAERVPGLTDVEAASPNGPGEAPAEEVAAGARALAARL